MCEHNTRYDESLLHKSDVILTDNVCVQQYANTCPFHVTANITVANIVHKTVNIYRKLNRRQLSYATFEFEESGK